MGDVIYRLEVVNTAELRLLILPATAPVLIDLKRFGQYDTAGLDATTLDNFTLSTSVNIDTVIFNSSREMHRTWLRQQSPETGLWSLDEIDLFVSNGSARITIWVYQIFTNVSL